MIAAWPAEFGRYGRLGVLGGLGLLALAGCASRQEAGAPVTLASARVERSDAVKYCADGQSFLEKDTDTGATSIATDNVDGDSCSVEKLVNGQKRSFHSVLGLVLSRDYSNFDEINSNIITIVTTNIKEVDFYERSSHWGAPVLIHNHIEKVSNDPVIIDNVSYPSVHLVENGRNSKGNVGQTELTFSETPKGEFFVSEVKSASPDHTRQNFRVIGLSPRPEGLKTAGL